MVNPYNKPRDRSLMKTKFWNKNQRDVYHMLVSDRKNKYVPNVKLVSLSYMEAHMDYFSEALALVDQFGLRHIISFNKAFDSDLVGQFFATVYFHIYVDQTITWMCDDDVLTCKWKVFMELMQLMYT